MGSIQTVDVASVTDWRCFNYQSEVMASQSAPDGPIRIETKRPYGSIAQDVLFRNSLTRLGLFFHVRVRLADDNQGACLCEGRIYLWGLHTTDRNFGLFDARKAWSEACVHLPEFGDVSPSDENPPPRQFLRAEIYLLTPYTAVEVQDAQFGHRGDRFL